MPLAEGDRRSQLAQHGHLFVGETLRHFRTRTEPRQDGQADPDRQALSQAARRLPLGAQKRCRLWIISVIGNRSVLDPFDGFVDDEKRNQEPFTRDNRLPEAILDLDVEARGTEDAVDQVFKLGPVDVGELVGRDDLHVRHEECRVEPSVGDPSRDVAAGHADLVQNIRGARRR